MMMMTCVLCAFQNIGSMWQVAQQRDRKEEREAGRSKYKGQHQGYLQKLLQEKECGYLESD